MKIFAVGYVESFQLKGLSGVAKLLCPITSDGELSKVKLTWYANGRLSSTVMEADKYILFQGIANAAFFCKLM